MELIPRSARDSRTWPREISYSMLAYMTSENTQTILMYLTWTIKHFDWRGSKREIYFKIFIKIFTFYILHFLQVRRMWQRRDVFFYK